MGGKIEGLTIEFDTQITHITICPRFGWANILNKITGVTFTLSIPQLIEILERLHE